MKQNIIVLLLICTVSSSYIRNRHIRKRQIDNSFIPLEEYNTRFKRAHNPRDFKTITGPRNIIRVVYGLNVTQSADPCDPYVVPKDLSFPGRRISEAKCLEYIWDLKAHHEKLERERECFRVMIENYLADNPDLSENDIVGVVGGQDADPAEFPHMGAIGWESYEGTWIFKCGGSLISHNFVLTAAHCKSTSPRDDTVADVEPKIVRFGDTNIIDSESLQHKYRDISIARIIVHPKYDSPKKYYDIALMELKESVTFTKFIRPACLWTKNSIRELGKQGTVTGWGVVKSGGAQSYPELQAANIDFLESDVCNKYLSPQYNRIFWGFEDHQLCAGVLTGGIDACQGDSGGPLQVKIPLPYQSQGHMHYLVGIIASGIKCGLENTPGIYTRVSSFLDWIEPIVWPNETIPRHS